HACVLPCSPDHAVSAGGSVAAIMTRRRRGSSLRPGATSRAVRASAVVRRRLSEIEPRDLPRCHEERGPAVVRSIRMPEERALVEARDQAAASAGGIVFDVKAFVWTECR